MDELEEYIMFKDLCAITGLTEHRARRFIDRYQIERIPDGVSRLLETKSTLLKLANAPEMHRHMDERGKALMREVRGALEPQNAA